VNFLWKKFYIKQKDAFSRASLAYYHCSLVIKRFFPTHTASRTFQWHTFRRFGQYFFVPSGHDPVPLLPFRPLQGVSPLFIY